VQNGIAVDIATMVSELLDVQGADVTQKVSVIGDPRSNSIILRTGSPERTELARQLIYKLDNAQNNPSNLHVVYLRNAQANKLAQALRGLLTGEGEMAGASTDSARNLLNGGGLGGPAGSSTSGNGNNSSSTTGSSSQTNNGQSAGLQMSSGQGHQHAAYFGARPAVSQPA
jgi:general secretion pathway protein D